MLSSDAFSILPKLLINVNTFLNYFFLHFSFVTAAILLRILFSPSIFHSLSPPYFYEYFSRLPFFIRYHRHTFTNTFLAFHFSFVTTIILLRMLFSPSIFHSLPPPYFYEYFSRPPFFIRYHRHTFTNSSNSLLPFANGTRNRPPFHPCSTLSGHMRNSI